MYKSTKSHLMFLMRFSLNKNKVQSEQKKNQKLILNAQFQNSMTQNDYRSRVCGESCLRRRVVLPTTMNELHLTI